VTVSGGSANCQAWFTYVANPSGGTSFIDMSTGNPSTYSWNFGDGSTGTGPNPVHTYANPGWYLVCLTISTPGTTCQSTWCDSVYVSNSGTCIANFGYNSIGGTAIAFNNNSTSSGVNPYYYWTFGDGGTAWGTNPIYTYAAPGTYQVCLMLIDSTINCWDTYCQTITIQGGGGGCSSNYAIYPDTLLSHTYWAYNLATGVGPLTYLWSWGDSTTSTGAYPSHTYAGPGLYTICLTITDATGCTSTTCYQWQLLRMTNAPVTINVIGGTTGIEEPKAGTISVFPNPAAGQMNVSLTNNTGQTATLELYNLEGRRVTDFGTVNGQDINMTLNLDQVPAGMYFLRVAAGNWMEHLKIVVK
jgi:PKD repeat protein